MVYTQTQTQAYNISSYRREEGNAAEIMQIFAVQKCAQ